MYVVLEGEMHISNGVEETLLGRWYFCRIEPGEGRQGVRNGVAGSRDGRSRIAVGAPDRLRFILGQPVVTQPGKNWTYSGGAVALIGALIARGTKLALPDFARNALFAPLGIDKFEWVTMDLTQESQMKEVYELLNGHYVEDDEAMFRFKYSTSILKW